MKKLFASMLAATMVAGMSVSAFAYVNSKGQSSVSDPFANTALGIGDDGYDFAISGKTALDSDGKPVSKLDGGSKVYYPIVVSGEQLDLTGGTADEYYYATKSSEIDDLSVKIDVDAGSKYVEGVSIVKKDLNLGSTPSDAGEKAKFSIDLAGSAVTAATTGADDSGTLKLTVGGVSVETGAYDMVSEPLNDGTAIATKLVAGTVTGGYSVTRSGSVLTFEADNVGVGSITAANSATVAFGADTVTSPGTISQPTTATATVVKAGKDAVAGTDSFGKIYCVEVKMEDYFGDEAKEVEFNLSLRNRGRIVFETEDDATSFDGEFELGSDSEALRPDDYKKFRNNELTLEIDDKTGVVTLDEAYTADTGSDKEDIEFIYLEGKDANFTFDVKASGQDPLYLELNQDAVKEIAVENGRADLTFFNFPGEPEFDFSGTAKFGVEDEDEEYYLYEIVDGELVETNAKYNDDDGVFELRTNTLGSYVLSDRELDTTEIDDKDENDNEDKEDEETGGDSTTDGDSTGSSDKDNANTGAADLIGVASALAVVSVVAAGAVALKK